MPCQELSTIRRVSGTTCATLGASTPVEHVEMEDPVRREEESDSRTIRASDNLDDAARAEMLRRRRRATNDPPLRKREIDAPWPEHW